MEIAKVGDLIVTNFGGAYLITRLSLTASQDVYYATTLEKESDYIGLACYYYPREYETIESLVRAILDEEGIREIVPRERLQRALLDLY